MRAKTYTCFWYHRMCSPTRVPTNKDKNMKLGNYNETFAINLELIRGFLKCIICYYLEMPVFCGHYGELLSRIEVESFPEDLCAQLS